MKRIVMMVLTVVLAVTVFSQGAYAKNLKIAVVDLRRAFYEYEEYKSMDKELADLTTAKTAERNEKVAEIQKMRDEIQLLSDEAKALKQREIDAKLNELGVFDRAIRQDVLAKKDSIFRDVMERIQEIVTMIGEKEDYDYILDSRNIMYSQEGSDITDAVLLELNQ